MSDADGRGPQGLERAALELRDQAQQDRRVRERQIAEFSRRQGWIAVAVLSLYLAVIGLAALAFVGSPFIGAASGAKLAQAAGAL